MKKYKVVSDCLRWHKGTVIEQKRLAYSSHERFYAQGFGSPDHIPDSVMEELIARGLVEKIEEERVKDYAIIGEDYNACMPIHKWITAVRRLSDGVEVKVGQDVIIDTLQEAYKITGFKESMGRMYVLFEGGSLNLDQISPLPEKKVLFTTEDGVDVCDGGEMVWSIQREDFSSHSWRRAGSLILPNDRFAFFSTREAAEEWVYRNKPMITVADLENKSFDADNFNAVVTMDDVYKIARERCGFKPSCQF